MEHPAGALRVPSIQYPLAANHSPLLAGAAERDSLIVREIGLAGHESNTSAVDAKYFEHDFGWALFRCVALPYRPMATAQNKWSRQYCRPWHTNVVADNLRPKDRSAACNAPHVFIGRPPANAPVRYRLKRRSARHASVGFKPDGRPKGPCYA